VLSSMEWSLRAYLKLFKQPIACVNPHSLSVLPLAIALSITTRCRVVYDAHEIETETSEQIGFRKWLSRLIERWLVPWVDWICLTSPGHVAWYQAAFPRANISLVRNCPYKVVDWSKQPSHFRQVFDIPQDHLVFLYQGVVSRARGTELVLDVFRLLPTTHHIVFMGFGPSESVIRAAADQHRNIHFHSAVTPDKLRHFTIGADVGIHMMDDSCQNHLFALPNKPMEYMNAGLPAIVSDLPTMSRLVRDADAGWVVPVGDAEALRRLILSLCSPEINAAAAGARRWAEANNWEREELTLLEMYRALGL